MDPAAGRGGVVALTLGSPGITCARPDQLVGDIVSLLGRDHAELDRMLVILATVDPNGSEWRTNFEGLRLGFTAHAAAEEQALTVVVSARDGALSRLIAYILEAHRIQDRLLTRLAEGRSAAARINDVLELRASLISHGEQEQLILLPSLRDAIPSESYDKLARFYAGQRIRALGTVPPFTRSRRDSASAR
jgi:hypothetical protein